ncbi:hypothetical protein SERLA73DRAFT_184740 [Serpula lacrymans var. lacrymans S7.3]|uniref:Uncharacterized protein n=2 Tax=Serpula lacrymans var. lacrymans TaxID=341189 RepID=F8Q503_SERL3|nr:uncharacterized protein SERLADRAFT_472691 [Serpula lacrymans var. lacrymans S7.9]EGN96630.1 hypothetical protein SERLA73DRAFT_184740 [Serpula lacrymans var. lacrymans S7.3]EGO22197.1 hypothetical protein SERLADRAFT_472691 [Serpula lacrymans var. lacrymans S7.9]
MEESIKQGLDINIMYFCDANWNKHLPSNNDQRDAGHQGVEAVSTAPSVKASN